MWCKCGHWHDKHTFFGFGRCTVPDCNCRQFAVREVDNDKPDVRIKHLPESSKVKEP